MLRAKIKIKTGETLGFYNFWLQFFDFLFVCHPVGECCVCMCMSVIQRLNLGNSNKITLIFNGFLLNFREVCNHFSTTFRQLMSHRQDDFIFLVFRQLTEISFNLFFHKTFFFSSPLKIF